MLAVSLSSATDRPTTSTVSVSAPELHRQIDAQDLIDLELVGRRRGQLEALFLRRDEIGADGQQRNGVRAPSLGGRLTSQARGVLVILIFASVTGAPLASVTVPVIWPVAVWAPAVLATQRKTASSAPRDATCFAHRGSPDPEPSDFEDPPTDP